jgi:hypothetical protein
MAFRQKVGFADTAFILKAFQLEYTKISEKSTRNLFPIDLFISSSNTKMLIATKKRRASAAEILFRSCFTRT